MGALTVHFQRTESLVLLEVEEELYVGRAVFSPFQLAVYVEALLRPELEVFSPVRFIRVVQGSQPVSRYHLLFLLFRLL